MDNQKIIITVPENLITKIKAADFIDENVELYDTFKKSYSGYGLIKLKNEYKAEIDKLANRIGNLKLNEADQFDLLNVRKSAFIYNYCVVNEALALGNTGINNTIYTKQLLEDDRRAKITLQKELIKNKRDSNLKRDLRDDITKISERIEVCKSELTEYNNNINIEIELLDIDE